MAICSLFFHADSKAEEDWVLYGITKYLILSYNPKSITHPSKDTVRLQIKVLSKCNDSKGWTVKDHPNCSNIEWDYVLTLTEINCPSKQDRDIESVGYDKEGKSIASSSDETSPWSDIVPDSYTEILYKSVCP
ncbi:MAG TPA: surface-adhesin E family protein [Thermodesulfobacteriota bacterium]|nr:surface-adhesin E family protein [Thermodesulfobacteriota bacterium]